jgi:hypothetical protein
LVDTAVQKARPQKVKTRPEAGFREDLLLITTLVARLAKELAVLLLRHTLAALLDN